MSGAGVGTDTSVAGLGVVDTNASTGAVQANVDVADTRLNAGESNVQYIGKEPRLLSRSGDLINPVQQGMCSGICDSHADVSGQINISMQYLFATAGTFELSTEGRVQGNINIYAERPGSVGGSLKVALEAKTLGVDIVDSDPAGGGFANKTVIVSHAQLHPLKVVFGPGMNFLDRVEVEIGSGLPGPDSVTVTTSQMTHIDVNDIVGEDGVRSVILTPGMPPKA